MPLASFQLLPESGPRPVVLLLLDGWGLAPAGPANAIDPSLTPNFNRLIAEYPVAALKTDFPNPVLSYLAIGTGQPAFSPESSYEGAATLAEVIAAAGLRQAVIAESEKLALATYFFKGKNDSILSGEDQFIVPSTLGDRISQIETSWKDSLALSSKKIKSRYYDFILLDIANLDLAASSGDPVAVAKILKTIDKGLGRLSKLILDLGGVLVISSAHGNAERILNMKTDLVDREVTENPVPLVIVGRDFAGKTIGRQDVLNNDLSLLESTGSLSDLAPTIIKIMKLAQPASMSGQSLV